MITVLVYIYFGLLGASIIGGLITVILNQKKEAATTDNDAPIQVRTTIKIAEPELTESEKSESFSDPMMNAAIRIANDYVMAVVDLPSSSVKYIMSNPILADQSSVTGDQIRQIMSTVVGQLNTCHHVKMLEAFNPGALSEIRDATKTQSVNLN